jgi:DNA-binding NtrC family response regulator
MANILVVEDNAQVAKLFRDILTRAGHYAAVAANGNEATLALEKQAFDLVITDIFMPEKDGLELIREVMAHNPGLKVIAISGGGKTRAPLYLEMAKKLGACRTLNKPFELKELLKAVEETISDKGA